MGPITKRILRKNLNTKKKQKWRFQSVNIKSTPMNPNHQEKKVFQEMIVKRIRTISEIFFLNLNKIKMILQPLCAQWI